ncbi:MAG: efflux RND transporter periplasmic adaptor subunit, partial [Anaerolineae bacterium]|nr:efflux RND transporter periplasmic adaptor subunit [Anaerolineae bacterium]
ALADLKDVETPDLTDLQTALRNAQDNLTLALLQQTLAEHDSLARNVRDLEYAVDWHNRRITELEGLVAQGKANAEQVQALADEREALGKAQAELARVRTQRELSLAATAAEVAKARASLAEAQEALREAQSTGTSDTDAALTLTKARLAVRDAEVALAAAKDARAQLDQGPDPVTLAAAQADADKKRLALADAEAALAATRLVAPFAGTVLQTFVSPGDTIAATTRILSLANLDQLQVVASVDETAIRSVAPDQLAQITFDALPGQTLSGRVVSVPLQGTLQGGVTVYQVPIALDDALNLPLLVGMTANVKILTGQVENALLVPTMALQKVGGLYQVRVPNPADPAQPIAVPVEVGLSDGTYTQIVRGLNPGDQVVVELTASSSPGFTLRGFGSMGFPTGPTQQRPNR